MRGRAASAAQNTPTNVQARRRWLIKRARYMRANPTDAERKLWYIVRDRRLSQLRWRRQEVIDDLFIVDFICFEHRLIVEADGSQHGDNKQDADRDAYLRAQGFTVMRFWNAEIFQNLDGVAISILYAVESLGAQTRADPTPCPLPQGERGRAGAFPKDA